MNEAFERRIHDRETVMSVVGLGYVGMPLAMAFADAGFRVIGVDVVPERVRRLAAGQSHLIDVPAQQVRAHVAAGRFQPTCEYEQLRAADVVFVCVPTPFDRAKAPDLSFVLSAARSIAVVLRRDHLVILESTTYPGTTEEVFLPILEGSGLRAGTDFFVAFSPERIDPGNRTFTIANTPKVVGGIDAESTERAALVLEQIVRDGGVHRVSTPRAAELSKLLENTFRAVNIALVNELAMLCDRMGIDVWEVIEAARTKPYGFMSFTPGPGPGGHCIPVDPYYLSWKAREYDFSTKFIEVAAEINQDMPFFVVDKLRRELLRRGVRLAGANVLALGAAFKRDIDDARNSTAIRVMEVLLAEGATVRYHDPYVPALRLAASVFGQDERPATELRSTPLTDEAIAGSDCAVVLVAHGAIDLARVVRGSPFVFDVVNATAALGRPANIVRL